jgi:hypothetical protein
MVAPITPQNVQSPQSVTRKRRLAEAMMQQGTDTSPVGHPLGALARAMQGGMAGYMSHKADTAEKEGLASVMAKMQSGDNAGVMTDPWATDGMSRLAQVEYERSLPQAPPPPTDDMREFDYAQQNPAFADYQINQRKAGASSQNVNVGNLTEGQGASANFYTRGKAANDNLAPMEQALTSYAGNAAAQLPDAIGNLMKSPEYQMAERNGREFLAVILRKDTGAAVTKEEWEFYAPMYLPQPGNPPEVLKAKREARERALGAIRLSMGQAGAILDQQPQASPQAAPQAAPQQDMQPVFEDPNQIPEGATVEDDNGQRFIKQGGQLVPVQ